MTEIWVLELTTESGDDYRWLFNREPTEDEVFKIFQRDIEEELGDDPDDKWGCAQSWNTYEETIEIL